MCILIVSVPKQFPEQNVGYIYYSASIIYNATVWYARHLAEDFESANRFKSPAQRHALHSCAVSNGNSTNYSLV